MLASAALALGLHIAVFSVPVRMVAPEPLVKPVASPTARVRTLQAGLSSALTTNRQDRDEASLPIPTAVESSRSPVSWRPDMALQDRTGGTGVNASPQSGGLVLRATAVLGEEDFFSRDALDVGPIPATPVLIAYPSVRGETATHVGTLALLINEVGTVVRVRFEDNALPPDMQDAARAAFMGATFAPGVVEGLPVRSKIRVEVTFEAGTAGR